jgi:hypothetical protein
MPVAVAAEVASAAAEPNDMAQAAGLSGPTLARALARGDVSRKSVVLLPCGTLALAGFEPAPQPQQQGGGLKARLLAASRAAMPKAAILVAKMADNSANYGMWIVWLLLLDMLLHERT